MPRPAPTFTWLDTTVVIVYCVGITLFGLWISRKTRTSGGYFLGGRQLPWWIMIGQAFGTGTHAEGPVGQAGASYQHGFATIWYQWKNMMATPFYWLMAPWYRRTNRTTVGEIVQDRYGQFLAFLYSVFAILYFVFNQGTMLKGAGKVIAVATNNAMTPNEVVLSMAGAFLVYSFFGGLRAAAYTNFIQGFLIIVLSFMLIPWGLKEVGGISGMRQCLRPEFFQLYNQFSQINLTMIAMLTLNGLVGITAQPHILSMCATGRTERAGRVGQTYGSFVKRFCTIGWAFTGLIVAAMLCRRRETLSDPEQAFGYACLHLLGPGLTGLLVACVLAANMSACSNFMVNIGALFTRNFYVRFFRPSASDKELLWVGRTSGLALTLVGVGFALIIKEVLQTFLFNETLPAFMGIMFMGGILWRRANRHGATASIIVAFVVYYVMNHHLSGAWHLVYKWQAAPFGWAMLAGFVALLVVSMATPAEAPARINAFFDSLRRTSNEAGLPAGQPQPWAADCGEDLLLYDLPGWLTRERWHRFFYRYREDLAGFLLAWVSVGLIIAFAWGLIQI
ncbi:MAG: sodium:solute symporter family protein [Verrucomicrobiota bacterium]